jgi:hypothetical protein
MIAHMTWFEVAVFHHETRITEVATEEGLINLQGPPASGAEVSSMEGSSCLA